MLYLRYLLKSAFICEIQTLIYMKYIFLILSLLSLQLTFAQDYVQGQLFVRTKANNSLPLGKIQANALYPKEIQALISAYKITEITLLA